ncbi:unnamed protein product, partial [Owenia fusiformis]
QIFATGLLNMINHIAYLRVFQLDSTPRVLPWTITVQGMASPAAFTAPRMLDERRLLDTRPGTFFMPTMIDVAYRISLLRYLKVPIDNQCYPRMQKYSVQCYIGFILLVLIFQY